MTKKAKKALKNQPTVMSNPKSNTVWVVTGKSESGDHYGPWVLSVEPNKNKLKEICELCDWPDDEEDGPGVFGSYTYLTVTAKVVDKIF